jgi:hypothetical protein
MSRKPQALALLLAFLLGGGALWSMGQRMDIFVPVDALMAEKRYPEAIDKLRGLLVSAPSRSSAIKERIAKAQLLLADEQIGSQHYNEALSSLSLFWAQNPQRADQAQSRIRKINKVHEDYNAKAKELLAYMSDAGNRRDPAYNRNVAKRLQELDDLDRNNPDSKKTITSLKEVSLALINQDSMKVVMSAGRALIDKAQYVPATREYLKGFTLFKPEFENAGYDDITMQAVARLVRQDETLPDSYEAAQAGLAKATEDLEAAFKSGLPDRIEAALPPALRSLDELRGLREAVFATGESLAKGYENIPKEGKSPIEYQYLAYLDIFTRGRPDVFGEDKTPAAEKGKSEGIGGALLAQTEAILDRLQKDAESSVDEAYAGAEKSYDAGRMDEARAGFARAAALVAPGARILSEWSLLREKDFVPDLAALRAKMGRAPAVSGRLAQLEALANASARLSGLASSYASTSSESSRFVASLSAQVPLKDARAALDGYRSSIRAAEASLAAEIAGRDALTAGAAAAAAALGDDRPQGALAAYSARLDKARADALAVEFAIAAARGAAEGDYIERELAIRTEAVAAAEAQIAGAASTRPERARAGYLDPSPSQSAAALASEGPRIAALASWTSGDLSSMGGESAALAAYPSFSAARARIEGLDAKARALQERRAAALAKALEKKQAAAATLARAKADMDAARARLDDAKSWIAKDKGKGAKSAAIRKDFADSRDRLDRSLAGIVESSNSDFDAKTWDDFQKLYATVSADVSQTKKDYTINETFRLLGEGQTYYEQALFDLAGESLGAAQDLWHEENDADQEQVKYWQNLVKQASDTNNKREVKQSDALYYEIGSYLSEARKLYQKGDGLMKSGIKADADAAFETARQNISFVTRAFPLNAEAGLLTLQILKSTDVDAYKKSLPRRIQEAVDLLASDASAGYSRIADLYKMEPGYPGLKAILEKAEIKVGKRRAPPTKDELANAASFVSKAEKLLASGRKDDAAKAEASLNSALGYDPANKRALALLRDLKTLQGKTAGPSLGLADQAVLDQATRSFAAQQYNQARDQLSQLLSDPNKRTREVLKLDNDLKTLGYN